MRRHLLRVKATAIIREHQRHRIGGGDKFEFAIGGCGMADHVGNRFLGHPIEPGFNRKWQWLLTPNGIELDA